MATFIPKKFTKEVISMRISVDLLTEIDEKAAEIGISRNEFINQCITFAMENMEDGENPPSEETNEKK
ncbi:MAG: CopG family transcriptional regulator [Firmicutes bacterium]|nr:CopG family transcriptional regulator [Bacillota bacterium]